MNIKYCIFLILIIEIQFIFGQTTAADGECNPVNKLLRKPQTNNCCQEEGITCENGHITKINIHGDLNGPIPSELGNLSNLKELEIWINHLGGSIPPELGNLSNLETLNLSINELFGPIPPELGNLSNLKELFLADNNLSGSIPPELGNLSNLKKLWLRKNNLSGSVPPELGKLSNLEELDLSENNLNGEIPPEVENLSNLKTLYLSNNSSNSLLKTILILSGIAILLGIILYFVSKKNRKSKDDTEKDRYNSSKV